MINIKGKTPAQIRAIGYKLLNDNLGPDGMIAFLQQYDMGDGDYTKERKKLFRTETMESIIDSLWDFQGKMRGK